MAVEEELDLRGADWYGRDLGDAHFLRCRFDDADLTETTSAGATFEECDFSGARLNASVHTRSSFLRCRFRRTSLFGVELVGCRLTGSVFEGRCVLRPVTVTDGGDWSFVTLRQQDLAAQRLDGVRLREADLSGADLTGASLRHADLSRAQLHAARLRGADLRGAVLDAVDLAALDLHGVWLDPEGAVRLAEALGARVGWDADEP